ncbi:MAG TPA: hypothetical protein PLF59_08100 [Cyclobacteriaceae bacterium]|nr:hypothetical protein [Cyclobacteriaceae bacterium]
MSAIELARIINKQHCDHLLLITTMRQLISFCANSEWELCFDFVLDHVVPKKSKSIHQPNYIHSTCVYMTRNNAKSLFNRKRRERSDTFDNNGYWPTIVRAPRDRMQQLGYAKNTQALIDVIGCFDVKLIGDVFAGSGTTAFAAFELNLDCVLIELDHRLCDQIRQQFKFFGVPILDVDRVDL